jgi:hypothetical protein
LNFIVNSRLVVIVCLVLVMTACASAPPSDPPFGLDRRVQVPVFAFATHTFEFPNMIRARDPNRPDLYANYCFVLAHAARQFAQFARFDPKLPKLDHAGYVARVEQVVARPAREATLPPDDRIVIPGYASLRAFSRAEERAVKEGLGGRFWTWVHWTNWRVGFAASPEDQEQVAREIVAELGEGRLVQLLVTNWPKIELNHTVVVYAYRMEGKALQLTVWDPNNPATPGIITFDTTGRRFWATSVYDTEYGDIRAFRMYYSWFL